jgi:hypothetical protein
LWFLPIAVVVAVVLAVAWIIPFFFPDTALDELPWESGPFNIRFIGAVYLACLMATLVSLWSFRWSPGRVILPMVGVFTGLILIVSLAYTDRFDSEQLGTWLWFVLYVIVPFSAVYVYLSLRALPPADPIPTPAAWRTALLLTAAAFGAYGLAVLIAPETMSGFWPWEVDAFHGRLYSAIFITVAVAAIAISRVASPTELLLVGLTFLAGGVFTILGLAIVDGSEDAVDWSALGTWLWLATFAWLLVLGLALTLHSRSAAGQLAR